MENGEASRDAGAAAAGPARQWEAGDYLAFVVEQIHSVVAATVDDDGLPVTCVIDMMDSDGDGLYFLTARGKNFYDRLVRRGYMALSGKKGADTMSCTAVSVRGRVEELGPDLLPRLFEKNPYMAEIYPDERSRGALTVFKLCEGIGEWFDLSKKPIERVSFSFVGSPDVPARGYFVTDACIGCKMCYRVCPQKCIDIAVKPVAIQQEHCLHCGMCREVCPAHAVVRR